MNPRRWDVGFISCSASKNPTGTTPTTLYRGTIFAIQMKHAMQRCDQVIIVSAKYGLLQLTDSVSWYDQYLGGMTEDQLASWRSLVASQLGKLPVDLWKTRLSYLPAGYHDQLLLAAPWLSPMRRPYVIRMQPQMRILFNEIKNYGINPDRRA